MKNAIFSTLCLLCLISSCTVVGQNNSEFDLADFKEFYQLEGNWKGMAGNSAFFESYTIESDTLIMIGNFSDENLSRETGKGELFFRHGQIFHTSGNSKWKVLKKEITSWFFEPVQNASHGFSWILQSPSEWTAVIGRNKYEMKKIK